MKGRSVLVLLLTAGLSGAPVLVEAHDPASSTLPASQLADLAFDQHPGAPVPLDAALRDEQGHAVPLASFVRGRPVLLILEYLRCPNLCDLVFGNIGTTLAKTGLLPGKDFELVAVSIDPHETPADARLAKAEYVERFGNDAAAWHFLTGTEKEVRRIATAVGFPYRYDAAIGQFAHPAGVTLVSPDGRVSRYILGLGFSPRDLRLGLTEASAGTIAAPAARLLLLCYGYDPSTGRYSLLVMDLIRVGGAITVLVLGGLVGLALHSERRRGRRA